MKLLLIGGTGVLSGSVVAESVKCGNEVTIVNRGNRKKNYPQGVNFIKADYHNQNLMSMKLKGLHFDAVIDFLCYTKEQIVYSVDLLSPFADQYIFISSACVYNTAIPGIKDEDSEKVLSEWDYSVNKWECEEYLRKIASDRGLCYTIIRPCVTYDDTRIPYGIMPPYGYHWTFVARLWAGKPIIRWDGGSARWNMMRVEDFAVGVVGLIGNSQAYNDAFNICGDEVCSWNDVVEIVANYLDLTPVYFDITSDDYKKYCKQRKGEIAGRSFDAIIDNKKIKKVVPAFKQTISLKEGVIKTLTAYRNQNFQRGIDWKFDANCDQIIKKWCRDNKVDSKKMNLHFVNYLNNARLTDKIGYELEFYKNVFIVKLANLGIRVLKKIVRVCG